MATDIGKARIPVEFDPDQVEAAAKKDLLPSIGRIAGDVAAAFAGKKLFDIGKAGLEELKDAEATAAATANAIRATGGAANVTAGQVAELAGNLSDLSGKDDELIQQGANLLLTFKNVRNELGEGNEVFNRATAAAQDLSVAGFGSMESASKMLGKALNDPIAGMTALSRAGVTFSDSQKATIKRLVETGDLLGAQKIILAEVESQVGGAAKAYGETLPGQLERAQTAMDNAKGALVAGLAPALELGASAATGLANAFQSQPAILQQVEGSLLLVGGGIAAVARPINDVITLMRTLKPAQEAAAAATSVATAATEANTAALATNSAAAVENLYATSRAGAAAAGATRTFSTATGLLGAAGLAAIPVLAGLAKVSADDAKAKAEAKRLTEGYTQAIIKSKDAGDQAIDAFTAQEIGASKAATALREAGADFGALISEVRTGGPLLDHLGNRQLVRLAQGFGDIDDLLRGAADAGDVLASQLLALRDAGALSDAQTVEILANLRGLADRYREGTTEAANLTAAQGALADQTGDSVEHLAIDLDKAGDASQKFARDTEVLEGAQRDLADALGSVGSALGDAYGQTLDPIKLASRLAAATDDLTESIAKNGDTLDINTEAGRANLAAALDAGEAIANLVEQRFKETGSITAAQEAAAGYTAELHDQLRAAGLSENQVAELIDTMNLTPEDIATTFSTNVPDIKAQIDALKLSLDELDDPRKIEVQALIDQGSFDEAKRVIEDLKRTQLVEVLPNGEQVFRTVTPDGRSIERRALGGPVGAGDFVIAGERGWELGVFRASQAFTAPTDGYIFNHADSMALADRLAQAASGAAAGITINGDIVANNPVGEPMSETIPRELRNLANRLIGAI